MNETYYSVEQIAALLHMHPKTIQRYIREGKLRAAKIGKSWRISGHDLSRFTEVHGEKPAAPPERTKASAVLDIAADSQREAERIIRSLNAAMHSKPPEYGQASLCTQYLEADGMVRLTLWGNVRFLSAVFLTVKDFLEQQMENQ